MAEQSGAVIRRRVRVTGLVQGVFFREGCRREAERLGVAGHVENLSDGSVEAVFEGGREGVDVLLRWCSAGPPGARVDSLSVSEETVTGRHGFRVCPSTR